MFSTRKLVLIIVLLITLCIAAYVLLVAIPARIARQSYEGAKEIGRDIREVFQFTPEITVNNVVVLQQQTPVLELAVLSQTFRHEYEWTNTWLKSTKKIKITGTLEAKAGFDLNQKFSIRIEEEKAYVTLPDPKLLSLEPKGDIIFKDENGMWNWVKPEDRSKAINAFTTDARRYATQAEFIQHARHQVVEKLKKILAAHGKEVIIEHDGIPGGEPARKL
jgi:hypothetical protein